MSQLKKIRFKVKGIHCKSCKTLIETEVDVLAGVNNIEVDYQTGEGWVEFDEGKISFSKIKDKIEKFDYKVDSIDGKHAEQEVKVQKRESSSKSFVLGLLIPLVLIGIIAGYYFLQYFGGFEILARLNESNLSLWLILLIGFLVSFHCVGMCGGLVVTYSASLAASDSRRAVGTAKSGKKVGVSKSHIQYNLGRLISYTVIGGVLGGVGSFFAINPSFSGGVMLFAGIFMILMAVALFTDFKALEKLTPKMPQSIARFLYSQRHTKKPKGPFIIGLLNGFMPCGPLQAMQLYALGTGSFTRGALSMAVYAAGTIPLMFGFGAFISMLSNQYIKKVMKFSAVVVGILGLIMINRGLVNFGFGIRSFIPTSAISQTEYIVTGDVSEYQTIRMELTYRGYNPNVLYIKKDIPVRWIIDVKQMSGCTDEIHVPEFNIEKPLQLGENIIEFTPTKVGEIKFSCWMRMVWGKFIVTDGDINPTQQQLEVEAADLPQGACGGDGSCGGGCAAAKTGGCGCSRIKSR